MINPVQFFASALALAMALCGVATGWLWTAIAFAWVAGSFFGWWLAEETARSHEHD